MEHMVLEGGRRRPGPAALRGGSAAVIDLEEKCFVMTVSCAGNMDGR